jgi:hypothetical protein
MIAFAQADTMQPFRVLDPCLAVDHLQGLGVDKYSTGRQGRQILMNLALQSITWMYTYARDIIACTMRVYSRQFQ